MDNKRILRVHFYDFLSTLNITNNHELFYQFLCSESTGDCEIDWPLILIEFKFNLIIIENLKN